jgi:hypothetical protein
MKPQEFESLPATEKEHYNYCEKCKEYFDLRDAAQVQKHVHGITSDTITDLGNEQAEVHVKKEERAVPG